MKTDYRIYPGLQHDEKDVITTVYEYFGLKYKNFEERRRFTKHSNAFKISFFLLHKTFKIKSHHLEKHYGIDHSTILHACKKFNDLIETDKNFKENYEKILVKINQLNFKSKIKLKY